MKTKKRSKLMVIFLSFLVCVSLMPMTTFAGGNSAPKITNGDNMPFAVEGKPYEYTFTATAGGTVTWEKVGAWPDWLKLDSRTGKIYGIPTYDILNVETHNVEAQIRAKCIGSDGVTKIDTKYFSFFVWGLPDFSTWQIHDENYINKISGTNLPDATQNSDYLGEDYILFSSIFQFQYDWPVMKIEGVPEGMSAKIGTNKGTALDGIASIILDGTPTNAGTYYIKVTISTYADQEHTEFIGTTEKTFTLKVNPESSTHSDNPMTKELNVMTEGQNDSNTVAKGNRLIYDVGDSTKAVFRILGEELGIEDLESVYLDGKLVSASNYDVRKESIIVSFKKAYVDSLKPGTHKITFNTTKGVGKAELVVKQKTQTSATTIKRDKTHPNTGDNGMLYVYALELLMAASGMLILNARRNKNNLK